MVLLSAGKLTNVERGRLTHVAPVVAAQRDSYIMMLSLQRTLDGPQLHDHDGTLTIRCLVFSAAQCWKRLPRSLIAL